MIIETGYHSINWWHQCGGSQITVSDGINWGTVSDGIQGSFTSQ